MKELCEALIITVQYLGETRNDEDFTEEDDVKIVEHIAYHLQCASTDEKAALIQTAKSLGLNKLPAEIGLED